MDEYIAEVTLEINGQKITDFSGVEEKEIALRKPVNLMGSTGVVKTKARYGVSVDYVVPKNKPEFDFANVENGTLVIDKENGRRTTYTGVSTATIGSTKYDGDKEATRTIDLICAERVEE